MSAAHTSEASVECAIGEFLRDPRRTSLELPPMPAAQRKAVKALTDQHSGVTCESFGLGGDRRLHLFKTGAALAAVPGTAAVIVKNTFIEFAAEDQEGSEPVVFRSMPNRLPRTSPETPTVTQASSQPVAKKVTIPCVRSVCGGQLDLSPISESTPKWPANPVAASKHTGGAALFSMSQITEASPPSALPKLLGSGREPLQVRNTFLHFDDVDRAEAEARSIQSMPSDMFRRCLEEELLRSAELAAALAPSGVPPPRAASPASAEPQHVPPPPRASSPMLSVPPPRAAQGAQLLTLGSRVVIQGLQKLPAFNGLCGVVDRLDETTGRYSVLLASPPPGIPKTAKVKGENLRLDTVKVPPPPLSAHSIDAFAPTFADLASMPGTPDYFGASPLRLMQFL